MFATLALNSKLTQSIRGTTIDTDSKRPLIGTRVFKVITNLAIGTTAQRNITFRLEC